MPHDIRVIAAREFLRADVHGRLDLLASKQILAELAACASSPEQDILIDVREISVPARLSSVDLFELVQTLRELSLGVLNRIAILRHPRGEFDRARFFEMLAVDSGFQVGVFEDFEAAFRWLHGGGKPVG
jgi:hypothetical protein